LQLVHERAENTLEGIGIGKDFLSRTPAVQQLREKMDKWDNIKLQMGEGGAVAQTMYTHEIK
jgi:uncharacterized FAD-dependent dehydrogenase